MDAPTGIQNNDVIVTKVGPQFWIWQQIGESRKRLDGPLDDRAQAESLAKVLADEFNSGAWFETEGGVTTEI